MIPFGQLLVKLSRKWGNTLYITGGFVRDLFLGRSSYDLDLVSEYNPSSVAMELARVTGGKYFDLNLDHDTVRVYLQWENNAWQVDIAVSRGINIIDDLRKRDFTFNAMALQIVYYAHSNWQDYVIDPTEGRLDLQKGLVRVISEEALKDDPIRLLRGIRLSSQLQFALEEKTRLLFRKNSELLTLVAGERFNMEFRKLLSMSPVKYLRLMESLNFFDALFPGLHGLSMLTYGKERLNGWKQSLLTIGNLEMLFGGDLFPGQIQVILKTYLNEYFEGWNKKQLLLLGAFFHNLSPRQFFDMNDLPKKQAKKNGRESFSFYTSRLCLSNREKQFLSHLTLYFMYPLHLSSTPRRTGRTLYRFYKTLGKDTPAILLFSLADYYASRELLGSKADLFLPPLLHFEAFIKNLMYRFFLEERRYVHPPSLLTGDEVMRLFNIRKGPLVGEILEFIGEAQAEGIISTRKEAIALIMQEYNFHIDDI